MMIRGIVCALLLCCTNVAAAKTVVRLQTYPIVATTAKQLYSGIIRNGPNGLTGATEFSIGAIRRTTARYEEGVKLTKLQVDVLITKHLPNWINRNDAKTCLQSKWDRLITALTVHEDNHVEIYKTFETELKRFARNLQPQRDEATIAELLDGEVHRLKVHIFRAQRNYDRETRFGALEGVRIGPC